MAIAADGSIVVAMETGLFAVDPDGSAGPRRFAAPEGLPASHPFNDLTVDPVRHRCLPSIGFPI